MPFATESRTFNTLFAATMDGYSGIMSENVFKANPLVEKLWKNGNARVFDGGVRITGQARFGFNPNTQWFSGADVLDMSNFETMTRFAYDWKMIHAPVTYTGEEVRKNSGKAQLVNLVQQKIQTTEETVLKVVDIAIASDGSAAGGKSILGLDAFFPTDPTADPASGAVGDITAVGNTWWQNATATSFGSFAANGPGGTAADNFFTLFNNVSDGNDTPDLIFSAQDVYEYYQRVNLLNAQLVMTDTASRTGDRTFGGLRYHGAPWYWSRNIVSGRGFMLRSSDIHMFVHPKGNLTMSEFVQSFNQDLFGAHLLLQCCFFVDRRLATAVFDGVTA